VAANGTGFGHADATACLELLLLHPMSLSAYPCLVTIEEDGFFLQRLRQAGDASSDAPVLLVAWRSIRGLRADDSDFTPDGRRLQVIEVMSDDGILSLLASAVDTSRLVTIVERWAGHWRRARSPLAGLMLGRRRRQSSAVA
jgi:hypothetical protein